MGQQCDTGSGEAALPDTLGPRHHIEPNVAVKNQQGADECCYKEVDVNPYHVYLNEAKGNEGQTYSHIFVGGSSLHFCHDHQGERAYGCQNPHPNQDAVGAGRWKKFMITEWPTNSSVGIDHHECDGEDGTAVGSDSDSCDQLTDQPGYLSSHNVTNHCGQVEDEEEYVCCQGIGYQQVTRLLAQGTRQKDAHQENRVGQQWGKCDQRGWDEK